MPLKSVGSHMDATTTGRAWPAWGGILLYLLLVAGIGGVAEDIWDRPAGAADSLVYSVASLDAAVGGDPLAWSGRSVQVHALVEPCQARGSPEGALHCHALAPNMVDDTAADSAVPLPLLLPEQPAWLSALRRLPLIGTVVPGPRAVLWGAPATYTVRIQAVANVACGGVGCFEAVLPG
jgi:hypothetical protein